MSNYSFTREIPLQTMPLKIKPEIHFTKSCCSIYQAEPLKNVTSRSGSPVCDSSPLIIQQKLWKTLHV